MEADEAEVAEREEVAAMVGLKGGSRAG